MVVCTSYDYKIKGKIKQGLLQNWLFCEYKEEDG